jgi:hypothetical protein
LSYRLRILRGCFLLWSAGFWGCGLPFPGWDVEPNLTLALPLDAADWELVGLRARQGEQELLVLREPGRPQEAVFSLEADPALTL